jgi:hypothetical protein
VVTARDGPGPPRGRPSRALGCARPGRGAGPARPIQELPAERPLPSDALCVGLLRLTEAEQAVMREDHRHAHERCQWIPQRAISRVRKFGQTTRNKPGQEPSASKATATDSKDRNKEVTPTKIRCTSNFQPAITARGLHPALTIGASPPRRWRQRGTSCWHGAVTERALVFSPISVPLRVSFDIL